MGNQLFTIKSVHIASYRNLPTPSSPTQGHTATDVVKTVPIGVNPAVRLLSLATPWTDTASVRSGASALTVKSPVRSAYTDKIASKSAIARTLTGVLSPPENASARRVRMDRCASAS